MRRASDPASQESSDVRVTSAGDGVIEIETEYVEPRPGGR